MDNFNGSFRSIFDGLQNTKWFYQNTIHLSTYVAP
jgi:hypothetical protein